MASTTTVKLNGKIVKVGFPLSVLRKTSNQVGFSKLQENPLDFIFTLVYYGVMKFKEDNGLEASFNEQQLEDWLDDTPTDELQKVFKKALESVEDLGKIMGAEMKAMPAPQEEK